MDEHLDERLSAYVDGELSGPDLDAAEAHLAACRECRAAVGDLRRLLARARGMEDRPPARDLWSGIAERIGAGGAVVVPLAPRRRRFAFSVPQLAAAGVALALMSAAGTFAALRLTPSESGGSAPRADATVALPAAIAGPYEAAIRELEGLLDLRRGQLDTATVRAVENSLAVIDLAIAQALEALERDPGNAYLNGHLRSTLDRKLELLRRAAMLPRAI